MSAAVISPSPKGQETLDRVKKFIKERVEPDEHVSALFLNLFSLKSYSTLYLF